jgi:hypothetical protein
MRAGRPRASPSLAGVLAIIAPGLSMQRRALRFAVGVAVSLAGSLSAQPIPVSYVVRLVSATVYDTRSRDEDSIHASLTVFVNGERKGASIWDGKGWDGSRIEGRAWVTGLHLFGTPTENNLHVSTGRLQDADKIEIVFEILNLATTPSSANYESAAGRIQQAACAGGDGNSAWECLAPQAANILAGWPVAGCEGLVAADKLAYPSTQLRRKTETGDTVTVNNVYRGSDAPVACGNSIYGVVVTIARE